MDTMTRLESLGRDLRYAVRQLRRTPGFTAVAIATLALGIGATAAMFSVVDAVVLKPLPYPNAARIVRIDTTASAGYSQPESWPEYQDMRRMAKTFSQVVGIGYGGGVTLRHGGQAVYLHAVQGTDNFFDLYGVHPLLGRTYRPGENEVGRSHVAVLSYAVWQQYFGGQKDVVGHTVDLNGSPFTVIGVMPAGFRVNFDSTNVIYTPLQLTPGQIKSRGSHWLPAYGLLKPGVTPAQATADLNHVFAELGQQFPDTEKGKMAKVVPLEEAMHTTQQGRDDRSELWVLLAAVSSVLLIACTNVAGLLLARGLAQEREMAVRSALGAARKRLVGQMLNQSILLGLAGALGGLVLGYLLLVAMRQFLERAFARGSEVHLSVVAVTVTIAVGLASSVGAGLLPAWRTAWAASSQTLHSGGRAGTSRAQHRLRSSFVVVQVALSLVLLVCSGLLLMALRSMLDTNLGFNPKHLLTLEVDIPGGDYKNRNFVTALVEPLEARVRTIPGVTAVGSNDLLPILQWGSNSDMTLVGHAPDPINRQRLTEMRFVTPGYFAAMQLPILKGRDIGPQDSAKSPPVAVVNEAWVNEFLTKGEDPLTQAFASDPGTPPVRIVGVAASGRQDLMERPLAEADFPLAQIPPSWEAFFPEFYLFIRTAVPPTSIIPQLRRVLHEVAPDVAFRTPETMEGVLSDALVTSRMMSWLFGIFATIAVLLTAIGIYGLLSQEVVSRTRDIGVRMALGATRASVARLILSRAGLLLGVGLGSGLVGILALERWIASLTTIHPARAAIATAVVILGLAAVGLLAAWIPALRATRIEPMEALRAE